MRMRCGSVLFKEEPLRGLFKNKPFVIMLIAIVLLGILGVCNCGRTFGFLAGEHSWCGRAAGADICLQSLE